MAIVGLTILIPADMNDNNSSSSNLTDNRQCDMHMDGINMDMSKNLNAKKYKDFVLKVDWKASSINDNSGVFVRFSDPDNDPMIAVNTGYGIQIDNMAMPDGNPLHKTGAIYNFVAPSNAAASKPVGQWNTFEIEATNQKYSVILNGEKVLPEFIGNRLTEGYIGIQNHDEDSHVSFKNIMIKEKKV